MGTQNRKRLASILGGTALLLGANVTTAATITTVSGTSAFGAGSTFDVQIVGTGFTPCAPTDPVLAPCGAGGGSLNFTWTPTDVNLGSTADVALADIWGLGFPSSTGTLDSGAGTLNDLTVVPDLFDPARPGARTADFGIATLTFTVNDPGASGRTFVLLDNDDGFNPWYDQGANLITPQPTIRSIQLDFDGAGNVTVSSVPIPAAGWLLVSALGLGSLIARRRKPTLATAAAAA